MRVLIKVVLYRVPYTIFYISDEFLVLPSPEYYKAIGVEANYSCDIRNDCKIEEKTRIIKYRTNALFLQPFVRCLKSDVYRTNVVLNLNRLSGCPANQSVVLKLILEPPDKEIIDYAWNEKMLRQIWMRVEIENAFSWLSTLGGAYSALGDYFEYCAEEAHRISLRQYRLSQMLGDESLAARSELYSALAFAQKGKLHTARHIVRNVNKFAFKTQDRRLNRMCQGAWAKLIYLRALKHITSQGGEGDGHNIPLIAK